MWKDITVWPKVLERVNKLSDYSEFALFHNIPSENVPTNGPPTAPNIVYAMEIRVPIFVARNARPIVTHPKMTARYRIKEIVTSKNSWLVKWKQIEYTRTRNKITLFHYGRAPLNKLSIEN